MKPKIKTAIVVLTYNRPDALLAVLEGLAPQCGPEHEVWIADDGSRPQTLELLRSQLPIFNCPVTHAWHPDQGFTAARARNLAAAHSTADYFIFMDGDCVPNCQFLKQHERLARPGCFVNGSRVLLSRTLTQAVLDRQAEPRSADALQWLRWRLAGDCNKLLHRLVKWPLPRTAHRGFQWKGIRSCNFALWAADFRAVNGFDETFSGWGHEDADLVLRLHNHACRRINGFLSTEVFHLWHPEQSRLAEPANRQRVLQRMQLGVVRAATGLEQLAQNAAVVMTHLQRQ
ncbi:MAG: glycosyltransferase [Burkholderiaceae bacterium]